MPPLEKNGDPMPRNPPWNRDELILALDLYFRLGRKHEGPRHPEVVKLSATLNSLPVHQDKSQQITYRNPAGVAMKLANFLTHDPEYAGAGLTQGNRLEVVVWAEFANAPIRLRSVANAIVKAAAKFGSDKHVEETSDDDEFPEGKVLSRLHKMKERNPTAVRRKKAKTLAETGKLLCEVCDFDFAIFYGHRGEGFVECHHIAPLHTLPEKTSIRLKDLAIVCANCHRMLHRGKDKSTIDLLKAVVQDRQSRR